MQNPLIALLIFVSASLMYAENQSAASRRVLFVLTSHDKLGDTGQSTGYFLGEAAHPYEVLTKAGYTVDFVSPKGGQAPIDGKSLDAKDAISQKLLKDEAFQKGITHTLKPGDVDPSKYAAIFYAGGHGAMWDLPENQELARIAARIYERGGVVAAVCHGPAALVNIKLANGQYLVAGKDVSAFTNDEETTVKLDKVVPFLLVDKLQERGAKAYGAANFQPKVVVSERLVTGQNPASATGVGEAMVTLLSARK